MPVEQADFDRLAQALERYAPHDGRFDLTAEGVHIVKSSKAADTQTYMLSQPGLCLVPQGMKAVSLTGGAFEYGESSMVVYAAAVPISVKVTRADKDKPYLCLVIPIDAQKLGELIVKAFPHGVPKSDDPRAVYVGDTNPRIVKSAIRLMELIAQQEDADLLVPLAIDEILIRLLRSPAGAAIAQIGIIDSHAEKVAKAIAWLKDNYAKPVKIEDLAKVAGMSLSSFHTHFKGITDLSPLQYQKILRLQEARHLMQAKMMDVSRAAFAVGYSSSSQFSREYTREFGVPPSKDNRHPRLSSAE